MIGLQVDEHALFNKENYRHFLNSELYLHVYHQNNGVNIDNVTIFGME